MSRDLALTFAGGGNRAFYQLGLLRSLGADLLPRIAAIASCSAGACVATMWLAGRHREADRFWKKRREGVERNFVWRELLRGKSPTPHAPIYRDTLLHAFDDGGLERVRKLPFPLYVLASSLPTTLPTGIAVALGMLAYTVEKRVRPSMIHPTAGRVLGFRPVVVDARDCTTKEELAELVLASSSTPPFTPLGNFRGEKLLDGGHVDNVPAFVAEHAPGVRKNVVLLTRPYPPAALGRRGKRLYVAPTKPVPIGRWDYTRPDLLDATIAMGEAEADAHRDAIARFVATA